MKFDKGRNFARTREILEAWLRHRLELVNATVSDLVLPDRAGLSNETILFTAELTAPSDGGTSTTTEELALRISPAPEFQVCRDPMFASQAKLLQVLHDQGLRVPNLRWFEDDPQWFERPFFVMDRAHGRVPISEPIYNAEGWLHDATPAQQRAAWESAVDELVRINRVAPDLVRFLPGGTAGFTEVLDEFRAEYAWACAGEAHPIVDRLWEWLDANIPSAPALGLSWGDARVGNVMFDDEFRVVVVMDWELASLGTPIMDLGWWLFFDVVHSEVHPRLPGLGTRQETIERWERGTGLSAQGVEWYEVLAGVRLATLVIRSMNLLGVATNDWGAFVRLAYERLGWSEPTDLAPAARRSGAGASYD
jgi:aminoglycoside phosphotransferase (APT) family kinase protein